MLALLEEWKQKVLFLMHVLARRDSRLVLRYMLAMITYSAS